MSAVLKIRPAHSDDEPFLRALREQHDRERLAIDLWDAAQRVALAKSIVDTQFQGHQAHYRKVKANWETRDNVIELDGQPIGRFIVTGDKHEIHLCDILIDRRFRGQGIGRAIIDMTKAECRESRRLFRLRAERGSRAQRFYQQGGFQVIESGDTHVLMEWDPQPSELRPAYFFPQS